jgi:hypothetical protein
LQGQCGFAILDQLENHVKYSDTVHFLKNNYKSRDQLAMYSNLVAGKSVHPPSLS